MLLENVSHLLSMDLRGVFDYICEASYTLICMTSYTVCFFARSVQNVDWSYAG